MFAGSCQSRYRTMQMQRYALLCVALLLRSAWSLPSFLTAAVPLSAPAVASHRAIKASMSMHSMSRTFDATVSNVQAKIQQQQAASGRAGTEVSSSVLIYSFADMEPTTTDSTGTYAVSPCQLAVSNSVRFNARKIAFVLTAYAVWANGTVQGYYHKDRGGHIIPVTNGTTARMQRGLTSCFKAAVDAGFTTLHILTHVNVIEGQIGGRSLWRNIVPFYPIARYGGPIIPGSSTNSTNCTNNSNSANSTNCTNISNCTNSTNGGNSTNCTNSGNTTNCTNSGNTTNCTNSGNSTNCTNSANNTNCTNSITCSISANSTNCTNSANSTANTTNLGFSYADIILRPAAEALNAVVKNDTVIQFSVAGEQGLSVWRYPRAYMQIMQDMKNITTRGLNTSSHLFGVSLNYDKVCGCVEPEERDPVIYNQTYPERMQRFAQKWGFSGIDMPGVQQLLDVSDFIGFSSYAPLPADITPESLEISLQTAAWELQYFGINLKRYSKIKPLIYSEHGLGGGTDDSKVAPDLEYLRKHPFAGTSTIYSAQLDPWKIPAYQQYRRDFYQQLSYWAAMGGGPQYSIDSVYVWNSGSWDVQGVHPLSTNQQGTYADELLGNYISTVNAIVNSRDGSA